MKSIPLNQMKKGDWSLNLEDEFYAEQHGEMMAASVEAVLMTKEGHYVNIITPGSLGSPEEGFLSELAGCLADKTVHVEKLLYVGECGCGGFVTRVYR